MKREEKKIMRIKQENAIKKSDKKYELVIQEKSGKIFQL